MQHKRIMIVEDEGLIAHDIADQLRNGGYDIAGISSSAEDALAVLLNVVPELPREAVGSLYTTNRTLLVLVPTNFHQPISNPYTEGRSGSILAYRGLLWVGRNGERAVSY